MATCGSGNGSGVYQRFDQQCQPPLTSSDVSYGNRHTYYQKPRANVIEEPHEVAFYEDPKVRYTTKVCKINGVPKIGFTRFYYVAQLGKYLPGTGCYMSIPGWIAFTQNTAMQQELLTRGKAMQEQCM